MLSQASNGLTNEQIGLALDISIGTARKHIEHILRRLGVSSRTAAAVQYLTVNAQTNPPRDEVDGNARRTQGRMIPTYLRVVVTRRQRPR